MGVRVLNIEFHQCVCVYVRGGGGGGEGFAQMLTPLYTHYT